MAGPSKAHLLTEVHQVLKERYPIESGPPPKLTVLEAVIFGICREGTTRDQANQALSRFKVDFFDMNEVRVSTIPEIQERLAGIPQPEERAQRIRRFLRQLFNHIVKQNEKTRLEHVLDPLMKKPLKEALKVLEQFEALSSDYVCATVVQLALGGHAIPIDAETQRALEQLGVAEAGTDVPSLRNLLERAIPKNRGVEFVTLIEELAHETRGSSPSASAPPAIRQVIAKALERINPQAARAEAKASAAKGESSLAHAPKASPAAGSDPEDTASANKSADSGNGKTAGSPKAQRAKSSDASSATHAPSAAEPLPKTSRSRSPRPK